MNVCTYEIILFFVYRSEYRGAISWKFNKLQTVCRSSCEAEYIKLSESSRFPSLAHHHIQQFCSSFVSINNQKTNNMLTLISTLVLFGTLGFAIENAAHAASSGSVTKAMVTQFAPGTHNCTSKKTECLTTAEVSSMSAIAYKDWQVPNRNALAAILATISFESLDFKYCMNLAHPDMQGTYSQISLPNLIKYGASLHPPRNGSSTNTTSDKPFIQSLCNNKQIAFETGFWYFMKGDYPASVRDAVEKKGSDAAYTDYVTKGLSAPMTPQRLQKFQLVKKVLFASNRTTLACVEPHESTTKAASHGTTNSVMSPSSSSMSIHTSIYSSIPYSSPTVAPTKTTPDQHLPMVAVTEIVLSKCSASHAHSTSTNTSFYDHQQRGQAYSDQHY